MIIILDLLCDKDLKIIVPETSLISFCLSHTNEFNSDFSQIRLFEGDNFPHKKLFPQKKAITKYEGDNKVITLLFGCYRPHFEGDNPRNPPPLGWITGSCPR